MYRKVCPLCLTMFYSAAALFSCPDMVLALDSQNSKFDVLKPAIGEPSKKANMQYLKHPVLNVAEFEPLTQATDVQLFRLNSQMFENAGASASYINRSHCFRSAESMAVKQFAERAIGLTKSQLVSRFGYPSTVSFPDVVGKKGENDSDIWVYIFGYESIQVKVLLRSGMCVQAQQLLDEEWATIFQKRCNEFINAEGLTTSEIIRKFGKPTYTQAGKDGSVYYLYSLTHTFCNELLIEKDRCVSSHITGICSGRQHQSFSFQSK